MKRCPAVRKLREVLLDFIIRALNSWHFPIPVVVVDNVRDPILVEAVNPDELFLRAPFPRCYGLSTTEHFMNHRRSQLLSFTDVGDGATTAISNRLVVDVENGLLKRFVQCRPTSLLCWGCYVLISTGVSRLRVNWIGFALNIFPWSPHTVLVHYTLG